MQVVCAGGGPASLYLAILLKLQDPGRDVRVHERDPAGATYGWGVTYWPEMLARLAACDEVSAHTIEKESVCWSGGVAHIRDRTTSHDGDEGFAIGRHRLLEILAERATGLGVDVRYGHPVLPGDPALDGDLVVAGDGSRSALRDEHREHFGTRVELGNNRFVWLGTTRVFTSFTFAFVDTGHGWLWCYAYGFDGTHSTCVVECSPETWAGLGLGSMARADTLKLLESLLAKPLRGHPLIDRTESDGPLPWQQFRTVTNRVWSRGNLVLLGDAAHTTHYSIGAGTTLAMQDAMALARALRDPGPLPAALGHYERTRRRELLPHQSAARHSANWYENLTRYVDLAPHQMFALLGQRHSPLLPYVPPQLYYRVDRAVDRTQALRSLKRWLGPRVARILQNK
ncbi:FAD-dependent monooxygenase [Streptomyces sp. VRA16 Mangrove soil]|uniref:FAD-dependent monooxygenase n=1 Tax=Streptomyces sp. VRA16 Mangrove soil TaxID=2817434 RepID=UPI001A9FFBFC|nr:FAD-dependent monooxygenase [Streptomyces sp. VRA16 Mangrove soil]MBO1337382.1 FAD-dependent monooxygenase [Streptomyces sp. VRA16 Mangrove soil]